MSLYIGGYMKRTIWMTLFIALTLTLLTACGSKAGGTISGTVMGDYGEPLGNIFEEELMVVALLCDDSVTDIDCLHSADTSLDAQDLIAGICAAEDTSPDCLVHLGQGAVVVDAEGKFSISDIPDGEYGYAFIIKTPGLTQITSTSMFLEIEAGGEKEIDINTDLHR